jgi:hypothetical protein
LIAAIRIGDGSPSIALPHLALGSSFRYMADVNTWPCGWRSGCCHSRFTVKVHTVQLLVVLPYPHSRGVHRHHRFMAKIATASLLTLSRMIYLAHCSGLTTALPRGFMCVCSHLPSIPSPLPAHCSQTMQIPFHSVCHSACLAAG